MRSDISVGSFAPTRSTAATWRWSAAERRIVALSPSSSTTEATAVGQHGNVGGGKHAVTNVRIVERLGDFTLVECRLETGRTHQVRIHLGETGTPLCGERIYDRPLHGKPLPDKSGGAHCPARGNARTHAPGNRKAAGLARPLAADLAALLGRMRKGHGKTESKKPGEDERECCRQTRAFWVARPEVPRRAWALAGVPRPSGYLRACHPENLGVPADAVPDPVGLLLFLGGSFGLARFIEAGFFSGDLFQALALFLGQNCRHGRLFLLLHGLDLIVESPEIRLSKPD